MYMAIKGSLLIGERDSNGNALALRDVGEMDLFEINIEEEYLENFSNNTPVAEQDLDVCIKRSADGVLTIKEHTAENLALALHGEIVEESSGSFTGAAFPSGVQVGQPYRIPGNRAKVSALVITDSAGTPATLVLGTHYTADTDFGLVTFINLGTFQQPFKAAGTEGTGKKSVALLKKKATNKAAMLKGVNIADGEKRVVIDLHNLSLRTAKKVSLGNKGELAMLEIPVKILADPKKAVDATMGRFGQYRLIE